MFINQINKKKVYLGKIVLMHYETFMDLKSINFSLLLFLVVEKIHKIFSAPSSSTFNFKACRSVWSSSSNLDHQTTIWTNHTTIWTNHTTLWTNYTTIRTNHTKIFNVIILQQYIPSQILNWTAKQTKNYIFIKWLGRLIYFHIRWRLD